MRILSACAALVALSATAACDRSDPPSNRVKEAMEGAVEAVTTPTPTAAMAEGRFAPRDECAAVDGAPAFLAKLRAAVEARDADALVALTSDQTVLDFGGGAGGDLLRQRLTDPEYEIWGALDELAEMGCAPYESAGIVLPWYFAQDLGTDDPFSTMMVTGERVPLYKAASANSEVLESISWDVVGLDGGLQPDAQFQKVTAQSGATGFIADESLRSQVDYRLIADDVDGRWQITALVAGD
ncbi:MAG: hypothetical protein DI637_04475 [Citromicrobium sp.]|nr:MAG: hypothetical protein DI637_04475 [Citromicrobium sp.]